MAILFAMLAGGVLAQSQELFWDINGTDPGASGSTTAAGTWNDTNTYWNTDSTGGDGGTGDTIGAWQPGSVAVFSAGGNATGTFTVSVSGTHQIGGLRFEEGTVSVNGGILQFSGGATFTHNPAAGDCPVNSAVQGNGVLTLDGSGNWGRLNGVVSENGGTLSVNLASGNWVFGGQHTYTGDMTITGYAVPTVGSTGSASSGNLTSGPFGTGTLILTSGLLRPTSGGAITIGNAVRLDGSFTFGETSNTHDLTFTGPLTLTGTRTLTTNGSTVFFDGALGDDGNAYGFTKAGTSALVLGGENTFTGAATINNGTLRLANAGALNSTAPVAVSFSSNSNTKTLQLAGHSVTVSGLSTGGTVGTSIVENNAAGTATLSVNNAAANTFAGVLRDGGAGALALTKTGAGTLTLSGSSSNTYTGLTTVSDGVLTLSKSGGATAIAGDILINGGRVSLGAAHQIADSSSITVDSGVWYNSQTETVNNLTINSAPTVSGYSWHLINNLNVGGTLKVTAGDVVVGSGGSAQANAVELTGGVLAVAANAADSTFSIGSGGLAMSGGELRLGYSGEASTALINLGGNFTGSGTASISTRNSSGPRLLDLQSATRTFDVTSGTTTVQPTIQNGGLTKTGDGTLILSGPAANTYTGLTTVNGGTLILNKTAGVNAVAGEIVVNSGTLDLGADNQIADASDITVNGSANFNNNARLETVRNVTLNSSYSNPGNHRVSNMTITGTLAVTNGVVGLNSNTDTTANTVNMSGGRIEMAADTAPTIFNVGSGGLTMSGATLRFGWGGIGSAETAQVNLGGDFTGSGTNSLDYLTLNAPRLLDLQGATRTFNVTGGTTTISPTIQNGGLTKTGGGTLTFSGSNENTYTGLTTVSGGTLALGKTAGVNAVAGNINVTGGTLTLNAANQIADTSDVTVSGAGRFSTGGPNYAETVRNLMMDSSVTDPNINRVSNLTVTDTLTVKRGAVGVN
ncbi:MAG: autotransporter-associated beta strand repeat-containing protein, partial [Thermoguttaceae bacterium]|nr:autotransporter-associated beta strand repeat-containing protein [Thermoguttaceae bacterium]